MNTQTPSFAEALANTGGIPSAFNRDSQPGTTITGTIVETEMRQTSDYETGEPETWTNGEPKLQVVITIQTDGTGDDDGRRRVYVKWFGTQKQELINAVKKADAADIEKGGTFTATFTGYGEATNPRFNKPKLYSYTYTPPASGIAQAVAAAPPAAPAEAAPAPQQTPPEIWGAPANTATRLTADQAQKASQMRGLGLTDDAIAAALGVTTAQLAELPF